MDYIISREIDTFHKAMVTRVFFVRSSRWWGNSKIPIQKMMLKIFSPKVRGGTSGASVSSIVGIPCQSITCKHQF